MLYLSGSNLKIGALDFINKSNFITLFSPYITTNQLAALNLQKKIKTVVVRWEIRDLVFGATDLEVFHYCKDEKIALFRNSRIHLKALWSDSNEVFFGSANITNRGIGEEDDYNFELNGAQSEIGFREILYFNDIISTSEFVSLEMYQTFKEAMLKVQIPPIEIPEIPTVKKEVDHFLISQLPMTSSPDLLYLLYSGLDSKNNTEYNNAMHDLSLFSIPLSLSKDVFLDFLKTKFNSHPFITKFKEAIISSEYCSMRFGAARIWFARNTTTVPTPRPYDLNVFIRILFDWICYFDDQFKWNIPGSHSQVIFYSAIK
jgi:hypothetical protein